MGRDPDFPHHGQHHSQQPSMHPQHMAMHDPYHLSQLSHPHHDPYAFAGSPQHHVSINPALSRKRRRSDPDDYAAMQTMSGTPGVSNAPDMSNHPAMGPQQLNVSTMGDERAPSQLANSYPPALLSSESREYELAGSGVSTPPTQSKAKKGRINVPWTPAEEQRLKSMRDAGQSWSDIAKVNNSASALALTQPMELMKWLSAC